MNLHPNQAQTTYVNWLIVLFVLVKWLRKHQPLSKLNL